MPIKKTHQINECVFFYIYVRPEIAYTKSILMEKHEETRYVTNSKDYSMSFKLRVQEIERGQLTETHKTVFKIEQPLSNG
jgi:hypothetical protein